MLVTSGRFTGTRIKKNQMQNSPTPHVDFYLVFHDTGTSTVLGLSVLSGAYTFPDLPQ